MYVAVLVDSSSECDFLQIEYHWLQIEYHWAMVIVMVYPNLSLSSCIIDKVGKIHYYLMPHFQYFVFLQLIIHALQ